MVGSLTGAVSSQIVTEEYEGILGTVGHRTDSAMAKGCLTARLTSRAGAKAGHSDPVVLYGRAIAQRIEYLLSVERWPFHTEPPDHYVLLSHLLDLSVSQSSYLVPLHYQYDVRPYLGNLRAPPLLFGRRPPQSNCLPCTVPEPENGPRLEPQ